ncbi:hypothetical protein VTN96DRAFT_8048 [Rasamsonia emersonii]
MPKRSWSQVDGADNQPSRRLSIKTASGGAPAEVQIETGSPGDEKFFVNGSYPAENHPPTPSLTDGSSEPRSARSQGPRQRTQSAATIRSDAEPVVWPSITRKVKACAACRKQKIKCDMDEDGPPCKRCRERNLSCKLNKSLQTLIDEESRWRKTVSHDLTVIHAALQQTLRSLGLPALPALHTPLPETVDGQANEVAVADDAEPPPLFDTSPQGPPSDDMLAQVPIESLYEITRLRSLRGEAVEEDRGGLDDFISRGAIRVEEAERLFQFYMAQLDPYIYGLASKYKSLESLRRSSPILTASICAVAACHQPGDGKIYEICNQEFRRLVSSSLFDRRISLDYLRALVIGTYWLSDVSWTLAGFAVRRASDINLHKFYYRIIDSANGLAATPNSWDPSDPEASIDPVRLWYLLYICDQHLSILYTRAPMIREDETIRGWRGYLESPHASQSDMRISSQVSLMILLSQVRELFGVDASKAVPRAFVAHINTFSQQLDKWLAHWSQKLQPNEHIGDFPTKGVLLHYHFGKLHLFSHVFRGLKSGERVEPIPSYFKDPATTAVSHATTILELLLNDPDLRRSILGVPHYFHTMIAFACVVLLKVSSRYRDDLAIDTDTIYSLIGRIINLLRSNSCNRYHLVHWMAEGLDKMLKSSSSSHGGSQWNTTLASDSTTTTNIFDNVENDIPEQPTFPSVDPVLQMNPGFVSQSNDPVLSAGPFLPVLETLDGNEYDLTDLSFNFI